MGINVRPLQDDLPFGARMAGVTWATLEDERVRQTIRDSFEDRGMIVFEEIEQTGKMQVALSKVIGPLKDHPVKTVERVKRDDDDMLGVITIRTNPEAHRKLHREFRRVLTRRFPYAVFYAVRGDRIVVFAMLHTARDPRLWRKRGRNAR